MEQQEKKVEYVELIYDLIFVYIVGRNNGLLHHLKNGFIAPSAFLTYILTALIMLQIWYYTTLFINRYGKNDLLMHGGIFVNMYLLYYMAEGIRSDWQGHYLYFNIAWALILINIAVMYLIRLKKGDAAKPWENEQIKRNIFVIIIQVVMILVSVPVFFATDIPLSPLAMVFGIIMAITCRRVNQLAPVEFGHLTERVMLFVVFTFGEMIIGISEYFDGGFNFTTVYFSLFAFLIVVGLFTSYGLMYDHIIDREMTTNGTAYMMLHVFLILSLNHITAALEFMQEEEVADLPKNLFLTGSFAMFFILMYLIMLCGTSSCKPGRTVNLQLIAATAAFIVIMLLTYRLPYLSIVMTLVYIISFYLILFRLWRKNGCCEESKKTE